MNNFKPDFVVIATYCQNRYKESLNGTKKKYSRTFFVKIDEKGDVSVSTTPHILYNAVSCILIHEHMELAVSCWYAWYKVEFINSKGETLDNKLDDVFKIDTFQQKAFSNQRMALRDDQNEYCNFGRPWEKHLQSIWNLYLRLKDAETPSERKLIADLFSKDEKIQQLVEQNKNLEFTNILLEKERDQYKDLLNEIQALINRN